jgi:hypothetical protein
MSNRLPTFRRLFLILTALGIVAMHAGLTGACADRVADTPLISASATMAHATDTEHPAVPRGLSHGSDQLCQATPPSGSPGAVGPSALHALIAPIAVTTPPACPLLSAGPARSRPSPEQSSLCVWRI